MRARSPSHIPVGRIARTHGLKGELKVKMFASDSTLLAAGRRLYIGTAETDLQPLDVVAAKASNQTWIARFAGIDTLEAAQRLTQRQLWASTADLPPLPEGEYYHYQLVGLRVLDSRGATVGTVSAVFDNVGADYFEIRRAAGAPLQIPLTTDAVAAVDLQGGTLQLTEMEGLLEDA